MFTRAIEEERQTGWTIETKFLREVERKIEAMHDRDRVGWEEIESVLLAVEELSTAKTNLAKPEAVLPVLGDAATEKSVSYTETEMFLAFANGFAIRGDNPFSPIIQSEEWFKWKKKFDLERAAKNAAVSPNVTV